MHTRRHATAAKARAVRALPVAWATLVAVALLITLNSSLLAEGETSPQQPSPSSIPNSPAPASPATTAAPAPSSSLMPDWLKKGVDWAVSVVDPSASPSPAPQSPSATPSPDTSAPGQALSFTSELGKLKSAIANHEYAQAQTYGRRLDEILQSDAVSKSVEFLKLESEVGTDVAIAEVEKYLRIPDLKGESRKAGEAVLSGLKSVKKDDAVGVVIFVVYILLENKIGHEAGAYAPVAGILADDLWRWVESGVNSGNTPAASPGATGAGEGAAPAPQPPFSWDTSSTRPLVMAYWEVLKMIAQDPAAQQMLKDLNGLSGTRTPPGTTK